MKLTLDHVENIADNIKTFWFQADKKPHHVAGQFIELHLPHNDKDKRGDKRWFTLSSSPTEELLSITTKFAAENGSSFKRALLALEPGTELNASSTMGDFVLPKDSSIPLIFVAGGIGCTPFRSIIKSLIDSGEKRDITLIYSARSDAEIAFRDIFSAGACNFIPCTESPLTGEKILELAGESSDTRYFYISGPEPMVEAFRDQLKSAGINKKHIFGDYFPGYTSV